MSGTVIVYFPPYSGMLGKTAFFFSLLEKITRGGRSPAALVGKNERFPHLRKDNVIHEDIDGKLSVDEKKPCYIYQNENLAAQIKDWVKNQFKPIVVRIDNLDGNSSHADWLGYPEVEVILIGVNPFVEDVTQARHLLAKLLSMGVSREKIWFFMVNQGIPEGLSYKIVEDELGFLAGSFSSDFELLISAENNSQLIHEVKPNSELAKSIDRLVSKINNFLSIPSTATNINLQSKENERQIAHEVVSNLWRRLQRQDLPQPFSAQWLSGQIDKELETYLLNRGAMDPIVVNMIHRRMKEFVMGYGPLDRFLQDSTISEVMINGANIYIEREGEIEKVQEQFESEKQIRIIIDRILSGSGRRVDLASPMCDVRLEDGSRVNVILPPLSLNGPIVTMRRFRPCFRNMEDLLKSHTLSNEIAALLQSAVEERKNILIAGNTGSGKTTLLNILSSYISPDERIITLEDTAELSLKQEHVVRLETRTRNAEGMGEITMAQLLANALRMRPDRIIIGECRGSEAVPMLQSMNTGHDGSMTTIHANSATDALGRLESIVSMAVPNWPSAFIREQISAGFDLVVYLKRAGGQRKVTEVGNLKFGNGRIYIESIFEANTK